MEVNKNCDLKICDFGLARGLGTDEVGLALVGDWNARKTPR